MIWIVAGSVIGWLLSLIVFGRTTGSEITGYDLVSVLKKQV